MNHRGSTAEDMQGQRSADDIRKDIKKDEKDISETVEEIGGRIGEKLNWRRYLQQSPYWTLAITAAVGFLIAKRLTRRKTPVERFVDSLSEGIRESIQPALKGGRTSNLLKASLAGIGTKLVSGWIKNSVAGRGPGSQSGPTEAMREAQTADYKDVTNARNTIIGG